MNEYYAVTYSDSLSHHGVKGMKWGVRKNRLKSGYYRTSARIYDAQAGVYDRLGNKKMAGVSRAVANYSRKKADSLYKPSKHESLIDRYRSGKRARIRSKYEKRYNKAVADDEKLWAARDKHKLKRLSKYDSKIEKAKSKGRMDKVKKLRSKKTSYTKDFDEGTRMLKNASNRYNDTIKKRGEYRSQAVGNRDVKKTDEYKRNRNQYMKYMGNTYSYGHDYSRLSALADIQKEDRKKKKRR